jgi:quaternary ammonium compound-resistance protein SugE
MAWLMVLAAGLFETGFAVALKLSHGMTRLWPTVIFAVCALLSFALLNVALRQLEVGAAYAVWTGIGAVGAAAVGMMFLGDAVSTLKLVSIGLILTGVIGLNRRGSALPAVATPSAMTTVSLGSTGRIASRAGRMIAMA